MKRKLIIFLIVFMAVSLFSGGYVLLGKEQSIKYLPRNEKVDIVTKDLGITLEETSCTPAQDLFQKATRCNYCVNTLKVQCPDCCMVFSPDRAIRCTSEANSKFPCNPVAFSSGNCPGIGLDNQSLGCGNPIPKASQGKACISSGASVWKCEEDDLSPASKGCSPTSDAQKAGCPNCSGISPVYKIEDIENITTTISSTTVNLSYQYTLTPSYNTCYRNCLSYTSSQSQCREDFDDCKSQVCGGGEDGGFDRKCKNSPDPATGKGKCDERLAWPECDNYTTSDCVKMNNEANGCLTDAGGQCHSCFRQLDPDLFYRFVARSREKIIVMWQITSTPKFQGNAPTYFYTMIKIIDDNTNRVVHESLVNQKSFQGSFSIFSATAQSAVEKDGKIVLETGKPYRVEIYYFIPPVNMGLNIQIDKVQIIAVRTRH
ncbi:MAG: hypothetical protein WC335_04590 [Candidatus Omnitrophota bacterium]|jgi:hypothetical protein